MTNKGDQRKISPSSPHQPNHHLPINPHRIRMRQPTTFLLISRRRAASSKRPGQITRQQTLHCRTLLCTRNTAALPPQTPRHFSTVRYRAARRQRHQHRRFPAAASLRPQY